MRLFSIELVVLILFLYHKSFLLSRSWVFPSSSSYYLLDFAPKGGSQNISLVQSNLIQPTTQWRLIKSPKHTQDLVEVVLKKRNKHIISNVNYLQLNGEKFARVPRDKRSFWFDDSSEDVAAADSLSSSSQTTNNANDDVTNHVQSFGSAKFGQDRCKSVKSFSQLLSQQEFDLETGNLVKTCKARVVVNKCEGSCVSFVHPSVRFDGKLVKNCACCVNGSTQKKLLVLDDCKYGDFVATSAEYKITTNLQVTSPIEVYIDEPIDCKCESCDLS